MSDTKIQWATKVWNPVTGCSAISSGCKNCYAKRMAETRLRGRFGYDEDDPFRTTFHADKLLEPTKWKKPSMIFISSMGDLFHKDVKYSWLEDLFEVMAAEKRHIFIVLTKRPHRMKECFEFFFGDNHAPNIWLGVSCENQKAANERIPTLLEIPAALRLVSLEPLLGPVSLRQTIYEKTCCIDALAGLHGWPPHVPILDHNRLGWVIAGCESGPAHRPMNMDWVRSIRDQCNDPDLAQPVPFFFKQAYINNKKVSMPPLDGLIWDQVPSKKEGQ